MSQFITSSFTVGTVAKLVRHAASLLALATLCVSLSAFEAKAQAPTSPIAALRQAETALAELIETTEPAIVAIQRSPQATANRVRAGVLRPNADPFDRFRQSRNQAPATTTGAGVVIDASGLILTQYLAIDPGARHQIATIDGKTYPARIKGADPRSGLAVLEVVDAADLTALKIGRAEDLRKGSFVLALGNPFAIVADGQPSASTGAVVNLGRKAAPEVNLNNTRQSAAGFRTTLHHFGTLIQTDARLGWNGAGGALLNLAGELVGVTTTASTTAGHEQPAGYAIPLNKTFRRVVDSLRKGEEVEYGMLGISFQPDTQNNGGVVVGHAFVGGPASQAGLQKNDRIIQIAETTIETADDLQLEIGSLPPNASTSIKFIRKGQPQTTRAVLAKYFVTGKKVITARQPSWRGIRVDYTTALPPEQLRDNASFGRIPADGCVVVVQVDPESVSWRQGVRAGMFISHVGNQRVKTPQEFWQAVEDADESVNLKIIGALTPDAPQPQVLGR